VRSLAVKRAIDVVGASIGLVVAAPILAVAAVVILVEDGPPILFTQRRPGLRGRPFRILKLRTMVKGATGLGAGLAVNAGDERILRAGDFMRKTGIDELPQLWNVLRGEMSLVGPRPTLQEQVDRYTPHQRKRLDVKPGITGWSQIQGRTSIPWSQRIEIDVWYAEHWTVGLDLRILVLTVRQLMRPAETYKGETGGWDLG
jgi:lipopolysaccharide/colanic/teichoic acid biosynthesis glycosyltransferase